MNEYAQSESNGIGSAQESANVPQNWEGGIQHIPVPLFASVMGLAGLAISWQKASALWGWPVEIGCALTFLAFFLFGVLAALYCVKLIRCSDCVVQEFRHPVKINFFPTLSISLLLLSIAWLDIDPGFSLVMWALGTALHGAFTLIILSSWMHETRYEIGLTTPAWFIPMVGNILVPVAGVVHGFSELSWFFFSVGLVFWLVLLTVMMHRLFFHPPIPAKLLPSLFILIAPPAVGFLSYLSLNGGPPDNMARILYNFSLFTTLLLFFQAKHFIKRPFFVSWWAYSFPMAAVTIATIMMSSKLNNAFLGALALFLLVVTTLVVVLLLVLTLKAIVDGKVFLPD